MPMRLNRAFLLPLLLTGCSPEKPGYATDEEYENAIDASAPETGSSAAGALSIEPDLKSPVATEEPPTEEQEVNDENARAQKYKEDLDAVFGPPRDPS